MMPRASSICKTSNILLLNLKKKKKKYARNNFSHKGFYYVCHLTDARTVFFSHMNFAQSKASPVIHRRRRCHKKQRAHTAVISKHKNICER